MNVAWSPPDPSDVNGVLTVYSVCIRTQSANSSCPEVTVPFTQTSYVFSGLRPYVNYSIEVSAATVGGFGPRTNIFQRTTQSGGLKIHHRLQDKHAVIKNKTYLI